MLQTKQCSYRIVILSVCLIISASSQSDVDKLVKQSSGEETTVEVKDSTVGEGTTVDGVGSPAQGDTTGDDQSTEETTTKEGNGGSGDGYTDVSSTAENDIKNDTLTDSDNNDTSTDNYIKNDTSTENDIKNDTSTDSDNNNTSTENDIKNDTSTENDIKNDTSTENDNNDNTTTEGYTEIDSATSTTVNSKEDDSTKFYDSSGDHNPDDQVDPDDPDIPYEPDDGYKPGPTDPSMLKKRVDISILDDKGAYDFNSSNTWLKATRPVNFGGITAYPDQFPFIAIITNRKMVVFTGTLLTNRWVITSSYHFIGDHHQKINRTIEFTENGWVYVGGKAVSLVRGFPKNSTRDNRQIEEIIIRDTDTLIRESPSNMSQHLPYLRHIALVRTKTPFEIDSHVFPARLGTGIFPDATICYIAGYAEFRYPQAKWAVRWKRVEVYNRPTCISRFKVAVQRLDVCSTGQRGRLACTADIGSPIVCGGKLVAMVTVRVAGNNLYGKYRDYASGCEEAAYFVNLYELIGLQFDWLIEHVLDLQDPVPVNFTSTEVGPLNLEANKPPEFEDYRYVSGCAITEPTLGLVGVVFLLRSAG